VSRTQHHPANRLARETSPYLLQHAHNPVDWFPWGSEAIERARSEDKPLFVSIGYATCYWCHVMERESFENEATAELLNTLYVPVKVDREQRPDIDDVYMTACQVYTAMTEGRASGGWPLNLFVDPVTLRPFYVGTYFPPRTAYGRPSFGQVLESIHDAWTTRRPAVDAQAERIAEAVTRELAHAPPARTLDASIAERAVEALLSFHDRTNGGFGGAPKFPQPVYLELLTGVAWDAPAVAACVARTLDRMASGGIFDQIAGGFHRYAVDAVWAVPHFEKMLYDNAQLAVLYARSAVRTGDGYHRAIAERVCRSVLRSMRDEDGSFFSAQDAEVDAKEGKSYVWLAGEVEEAIDDAELRRTALAMYGLDRGTNFQDPHHASEPSSNVLLLDGRPEAVAHALGLSLEAFESRRKAIDERLLAVRDRRKQPITDDKVLTAWNGLMIAALAEVGSLLDQPSFVAAAHQAAEAIDRRMRGADGTLLRAARGAIASIPAFLEDYAFLLRGRLALAKATGEATHTARAEELFAEATRLFADPRGGFFDTREGANELFVRGRGVTDGAVPGGNGMMLLNALDLLALTGKSAFRDELRDELRRSFAGLSGIIAEQPVQTSLATLALWRALREAPETLPGERHADDEPVRVERIGGGSAFVIRLIIAPGFHINAPESAGSGDALGGLTIALRGNGQLAVRYPEGEVSAEGVRVYRGRVDLACSVTGGDGAPIDVTVQPCDERACHRPRTIRLA
jgi:uncharacterized protein